MYRKALLLRNNSVPYPHQKTQGLPHAKFIERPIRKGSLRKILGYAISSRFSSLTTQGLLLP
jgi:hypothetical protein